MTSFSGLALFQKLFRALRLEERLRQRFRHLGVSSIYGYGRIVLYPIASSAS